MFRKTRHIYFIGIGGIGMSGMAELLHKLDFQISGSDQVSSERTVQLSELGITVYEGHKGEQIVGSDVVVYSSAVKLDNPEILTAEELGIPVIRRAEMLGELLKVKDTSIAIAGTHGKTTTSSILGSILTEAKLDPTLVIGGIVNKFQTNAISGSGNTIVVEADEFDRSFLSLQPTLSVITNLDLEHLDCYKNLDDLKTTFSQFANASPFYGVVSLCIDSDNVRELVPYIKKPIVTYGFSEDANYRAVNATFSTTSTEFDVIAFGKKLGRVHNKIPGKHNICNSLGAITMALELDVPFKNIKEGLERFTGVRRRFEIRYTTSNNIIIVDDYAHHPSEVEATISAAKSGWNRRVIAVFQPHLFTRTRDFYKDFARAFLTADVLVVTDIYAAREEPINGIHSQLIIDEAIALGHTNVHSIPTVEDLPSKMKNIARNDDMIITMGAGHIWRQCEPIFNELSK